MRYRAQLATEQFPPSALVRQAIEAERAGLGIGSGEALNGSPRGMDWPSTAEQACV